jgi:hypothetical protein
MTGLLGSRHGSLRPGVPRAGARPPVAALALAALAALAIAAGAPAARADVSTMVPTADAFVSAAHRADNFGTAPALRLARRPATRAYLQFAIGDDTSRVLRAVLWVYPLRGSRAGITVHRATAAPWAEGALTFGSRPAFGGRGIRSGRVWARHRKAIDVTPLLDGSSGVTLALTAESASAVLLASREAPFTAPRLVLERGAGPGGPTAPRPAIRPAPTSTVYTGG